MYCIGKNVYFKIIFLSRTDVYILHLFDLSENFKHNNLVYMVIKYWQVYGYDINEICLKWCPYIRQVVCINNG